MLPKVWQGSARAGTGLGADGALWVSVWGVREVSKVPEPGRAIEATERIGAKA